MVLYFVDVSSMSGVDDLVIEGKWVGCINGGGGGRMGGVGIIGSDRLKIDHVGGGSVVDIWTLGSDASFLVCGISGIISPNINLENCGGPTRLIMVTISMNTFVVTSP